jgi:F0F1-type ATP synthase membrane subunit b/b'
MFIDFSITDFFEILNFVVLVAFFTYLFKKKLQKPLQKSIDEKAGIIASIHKKVDEIQQQFENLLTTITQQNSLITYLAKQLTRWKHAVQQENINKAKEKELIAQSLSNKIETQSENFAKSRFLSNVTPDAVAESKKILHQSFNSAAQQEAYLDNILSFVRKEIK